ncbi:hypothetical protein BJ742DRAFT_773416 [Cladochytrium replicatum]|nr:hypothetical protein BJ742DRAFT_773416 [Cladochytrium replicatum]
MFPLSALVPLLILFSSGAVQCPPPPDSPSTSELHIAGSPGTPNVQPNASPYPKCTKYYVVCSGDSCWSIAQRFGITTQSLYFWNGGPGVPGALDCAQALCVECNVPECPTVPPSPPLPAGLECPDKYTVQEGDTCARITVLYHLPSLKEFKRINPSVYCGDGVPDGIQKWLTPGQVVCV